MKFYRQVEASSGLRQQLEKILRKIIHKIFSFVTDAASQKARAFLPGNYFQTNLIFTGKVAEASCLRLC
jgi:hypothetical protein